MTNSRVFLYIYLIFVLSCILIQLVDAKGFGGSKGGGFKGMGKGSGGFSGPGTYNRPSGYGMNMAKGSSGRGMKNAAIGFAAGAAGGIAAYSLMRGMSGSFGGYRPGYYEPGYGVGETCYNNEDFNGTVFKSFRCPLNGFPMEARYCCGESGKQFCCLRESSSYGRSFNGMSYFFWVIVIIVLFIVIALIWVRYKRRQREDVILVPNEAPFTDVKGPSFYQPPPPPTGYPPPPMAYPPPPMGYQPPQGNPYGPPPGPTQYPMQSGNPYEQQPYQAPYPPQQQPVPPYNPYPGGPSY